MFRFQNASYLYCLILAPIFLVMGYLIFKFQTERIKKIFKSEIYAHLTKSVSVNKRILKLTLEVAALAMIVVALARPQLGESTEKIKMEGIEVVFAIDVSNSMLAEDLKPNRLEVAKRTINRMLDRLPGYKVGLIAFAGNAGLISPLTTDYSAVRMFLDSTSTRSVSTQGTDFSNVMDVAVEAFSRGGADIDEEDKVTRVLVFLSDGEDHEDKAIKKAKKLVDKEVRIFTIAAGTAQGAPIPQRDDFGQMQGYKKDKKNEVIISKVNINFMRELAQAGHGAFYNASFSGEEIKDIEKDFDKLEKKEFESDYMKKYDERFQIPLLIAFLLLLGEMMITEQRNPS